MDVIQEALWELPPPQPRTVDGNGVDMPVARVLLDVPVYHLNQLFDYLIPPQLDARAQVGIRVKARLGHQLHEGWIIERTSTTTHQGKLQPLDKVIGTLPVLTPFIYKLCTTIAEQCVAPVSDVVTQALPKRHAGEEKQMIERFAGVDTLRFEGHDSVSLSGAIPITPTFNPVTLPQHTLFDDYQAGPAFLRHIVEGNAPRAVMDVMPGSDYPAFYAVAQAIAAALSAGRKALFIVPTHDQATKAVQVIKSVIPNEHVTMLTAHMPPSQRYRSFLLALLGQTRIVVGTPSAAYAPLGRLGFIGLYDEGDDRLRTRRSPYVHIRQVLQQRSQLEHAAYLSVGYARTVDEQWLVDSGWANAIEPLRDVLRHRAPHVHVPDPHAIANDPYARIPAHVQRAIADALQDGPVIVLVPTRGYVPMVGCARCGTVARCPRCHGLIELLAGNRYRCRMCGDQRATWRCDNCGYHRLRAYRIGSERTGQELARMFPQAPVTVSSGSTMRVRRVGNRERLVVATPSMAPIAEDGFAAGVVLDADVWLGREQLYAPQDALRDWMDVAARVRPQAPFFVAGWPGNVLAQSMIRWDSTYFATHTLNERAELHFPPAYRLARLTGDKKALEAVMNDRLIRDLGEWLGPVPEGNRDWAAIVRCPAADGHHLTQALSDIQRERSAHRDSLVKVVIDPPNV